jgi:signal transduction histidine kinase
MVHPWFVNDKLVGYIELGEEIEHIAPRLTDTLDIELAFLIDKSLLSREGWEEGLKAMGRSGNWDLMPNCVIADSTIPSLPDEFIKFAGLTHSQHQNRLFSAKRNGSSYRAGFIDLHDAAGRDVGDILVIKNVSKDEASLRALLAVVATVCFLVAALLVSFFYFHITGIEKHLIKTRSALVTEIEKRKVVENELRRHRDTLEEIVESRTAELEKTNIQLGEFAHLTAHDLKTPLRGIGTLAEWLLKDYYDKFDDEGRRQIDLLVSRVRRMDDLINAILQYTTIARNKHNERPVDLSIIINTVIADIRPPRNITITVSQNLPVLMCEEEQIRQVFHNLVANAIRFMDKPEGFVKVACTEEDGLWKFSVCDNGPGIEPQHFERIFRLFQTLSNREEAESTGIGLTMAKKIVELYGGRVWLTSKLGEGSTFFFTLPKQMTAATHQIPEPVAT